MPAPWSTFARTAALGAAVGLAAGCAVDVTLDAEAGSGEAACAFSSDAGGSLHRQITREALAFLRPDVVLAIENGNLDADGAFFHDGRYHFDECKFASGARVLADNQADAVRALVADDDPAAQRAFGLTLHALQDFYAHTNWVELGGANLVDAGTGTFRALEAYRPPSDDLPFVIVSGPPPAGVSLEREGQGLYPASARVNVDLRGREHPGLISGVYDAPTSACPASVTLTHEELAKDAPDAPGREEAHVAARALAVAQTRHEWCRLRALAREAHGDAAVARLDAWRAGPGDEPRCGVARTAEPACD